MSNDFTNEEYNAMLLAMEKEANASKGSTLYWNPKNEGTYPIRLFHHLQKHLTKFCFIKSIDCIM